MASIRRTLSPAYHDHPPSSSSSSSSSSLYQNGSISSKSSSSRFFAEFRRLFRRKPLYRCLLFFLIGFLLGILHFGDDIDDNVPSKVLSIEGISRDDVNLNSFRKNDVVLRAEEEKNDVVLIPREGGNDVVLKEDFGFDYDNAGKLLIVVTPTYNRVLQAYYLSRLGQVLRLVKPPVLWIVVEMNAQSPETAAILTNLGVMYRHLVCRKNSTDVKDRGVHQRNTAIQHIELHRLDGIVYFADDDNVYSLELFENIRDISRFGTWPVAMLAQGKNKAVLEGPVCNGSQVIGWHTNEKSKRLRRFHVDMSGFAFNSTILWDPKRWKRPFLDPVRQLDTIKEGFQETTFIEQVVAEESQMEGIPHNCGKIMNWHLHLDAHGVEYPRGWILQKNLDAVVPID